MKPETIQVLKDTIKQWVKDYNMLDSIIEIKDAMLDELEQRYQDEHCDILRYKEVLQEIKEYASAISNEEMIPGYVIRSKSALWRIANKIERLEV